MKRLFLFFCLFFAALFTSCKNNSHADAMKVGDQFMQAFAVADFDSMQTLVTGDAAKDLKEEVSNIENDPEMQEMMKYRDLEYTYDGVRSHIKDNEAQLYYSVNDKGMVTQLTDAYDGVDMAEMQAFIEGMSKYFVVLDLSKVNGKWLVYEIDMEYYGD